MKKWKFLFCMVFLILLSAGCSSQNSRQPSSGMPSSDTSSQQGNALSQQLINQCHDVLTQLFEQGALSGNWSGTPEASERGHRTSEFVLLGGTDNGDTVEVSVELYGNIVLNCETMEEGIDGYFEAQTEHTSEGATQAPAPQKTEVIFVQYEKQVEIVSEGLTHSPALAFGKSVVCLKKTDSGLQPVSCAYEAYQSPGVNYLKEQNRKLQPQLDASTKIDVAAYDKNLVDYVWRTLLKTRYVETPADITQYDLDHLEQLELHGGNLLIETDDLEYRLDASLLALMPHLKSVYSVYRLKDYSVFAEMNSLESLTLDNMKDEDVATLRVGHTNELMLQQPDVKLLDLINVGTETLKIHSWTTAIGGFQGCDKIQSLYITGTRSDMRLVNAETFPSVTYLNFNFYSDYARVRDLSQLATFQNAVIDVTLSYQACNNKTVESLQGVEINQLILNPKDGPYPLEEPDPELVNSLTAQDIIWESNS